MNGRDLKKYEKLIAERRYKSCYLHNEYIGTGTSNLDDISVDYDVFFSFYSDESASNNQNLDSEELKLQKNLESK